MDEISFCRIMEDGGRLMAIDIKKAPSTRVLPASGIDPEFDQSARPLSELFNKIASEVPEQEWEQVPADGSVKYRRYLYKQPEIDG